MMLGSSLSHFVFLSGANDAKSVAGKLALCYTVIYRKCSEKHVTGQKGYRCPWVYVRFECIGG